MPTAVSTTSNTAHSTIVRRFSMTAAKLVAIASAMPTCRSSNIGRAKAPPAKASAANAAPRAMNSARNISPSTVKKVASSRPCASSVPVCGKVSAKTSSARRIQSRKRNMKASPA